MKNTSSRIQTAYVGQGATTYDQIRFTSKHGKVFHELELNQLKKAISKVDACASILEVGCGTARFSEYLAKSGFLVIAADPSADMLQLAKEKCSNFENIDFVIAEGKSLPFPDGSFDFVFAIRVMNSLESEEYAVLTINEMIRVTRAGGTILIEFANKLRPLAKQNTSVRLSFNRIRQIAELNKCDIIKESGILIFSQSFLNIIPSFVLPIWKKIELISSKYFWIIASRGYITLRKS